jgi:serine/threonine protein kinase
LDSLENFSRRFDFTPILISIVSVSFTLYQAMAATLCGSPLYMAPEILGYKKYDARADLWSLGAILYEMVVGRAPFMASNHVELLKVIETTEVRCSSF